MSYEFIRQLNEAKLHSSMEFESLDISIEVPAGGSRKGKDRDGNPWEHKIGAHYGYIKGTHSPDGEHLDCYVRKNPKEGAKVYVMHQLSVDGSKFDEDKVMLGFSSAKEAREMFKACTFKPDVMYGGMTEFTVEHFRIIAYQASNSSAMLTDEATYAEFKDKGLLPGNVKSPLMVARRVSEGQSSLALGLSLLGEDLNTGDVMSCLQSVGYDGTIPDNRSDLEEMINSAYDQYLITGLRDATNLSESEFNQHALEIITEEEADMVDYTTPNTEVSGYDEMVSISFEDPDHAKAARDFANEHMINIHADITSIFFEDPNDFETYMQNASYRDDAEILMGDKMQDYLDAGYGETKAADVIDHPVEENADYTVVVHTQVFENVGSAFAPMFAHSTGRAIVVESGIKSDYEARKVAADVGAGIIEVSVNANESIIGIQVLGKSDFNQFYSEVVAEECKEEELSYDDEVKKLAGVKNEAYNPSSPSIYDLKRIMEATSVEESTFAMPASLEDFPKAMRIVGKTLIKNPNHSAMSVIKAVAKSMFSNVAYAEEIKDFIEDQTGLGIDSYAEEVRETQIVEDKTSPADMGKFLHPDADKSGEDRSDKFISAEKHDDGSVTYIFNYSPRMGSWLDRGTHVDANGHTYLFDTDINNLKVTTNGDEDIRKKIQLVVNKTYRDGINESAGVDGQDIAARWTVAMLADADHMDVRFLRGLINSKDHYAAVKDLSKDEFLGGVWQGLCDHFNGGFEIEDISPEVAELLEL